MSPLPSAVLILGLLAASVSAAQAGNNPAIEILPAHPTPDPVAPASVAPPVPAALAQKPARQHLTRAERREMRRQAALQHRAAKLALKAAPPSAAVATASPTAMDGAIEKPAPAPGGVADAGASGSPHDARTPPSLGELIAKHALENGVPVKLAQAVVTIESRGNPHATNHGALGLMQIKFGTARAAGFSGVAAGLLAAETNLHFGMKVLADAYRSAGGDICGALMRYQSGHLATHPNRANRAYCSKARSLMAGA